MKELEIHIRDATRRFPLANLPDVIDSIFRVRCSVTENHMSPEELSRFGITPTAVEEMLLGGDYIVPVASVVPLVNFPSTSPAGSVVSSALLTSGGFDGSLDCAPSFDCPVSSGVESHPVVGFGMAQIPQAYIFALFVEPAYENRGIGGALLSCLEQGLLSHGVKQAWLATEANPSFRAHGFYERLGWEPRELMDDGQRKYTKNLL